MKVTFYVHRSYEFSQTLLFFGPACVVSAVTETYLECTGVLSDTRLAHLLFALLKPPEIILYEKRRVELAHRHVVFLSCSHNMCDVTEREAA